MQGETIGYDGAKTAYTGTENGCFLPQIYGDIETEVVFGKTNLFASLMRCRIQTQFITKFILFISILHAQKTIPFCMKQLYLLLFAIICSLSAAFAQLPDTLQIRFSPVLQKEDSKSYGLPEVVRRVNAKQVLAFRQRTAFRTLMLKLTKKSDVAFIRYKATIPDSLKKDTALGYVSMYYTGNNHRAKVKDNLVFLVQQPRDTAPLFFPDLNGNLDFTDDGPPVRARDSVVTVTLEPSAPGGMPLQQQFVLRHPGSIRFKKETMAQQDSMAAASGKKRMDLIHPDRSFGLENSMCDFRLNTRYADTTIGGIRLYCSVTDATMNGLFTDIRSKKEYFGDVFRVAEEDGQMDYGSTAYRTDPVLGKALRMGNRNYELAAVAPNGDWVRLVATTKALDGMVTGGRIPTALAVKPLAGGKPVSWANIKDSTRYTLIDVWGSWCMGCVLAAPKLTHLDSLYGKQVQIVGLFADSPTGVKEFIEKYKQTWP